MAKKIPIHIITGFLGAGKTSFLAQLLAQPEMSNSAVIINEFGEISLDHLLVEYSEEQVFKLQNGCLCCNAQGDLVGKMLDIATHAIDRIIIETSGITDTPDLVAGLWNNQQIRTQFTLSGITTLVSATEWQDNNTEFTNQLAISDTAIVTKSDLLPPSSRAQTQAHISARIELASPDANICFLPLSSGQMKLFASDIPIPADRKFQDKTGSSHLSGYKTLTLKHSGAIEINTIHLFMDKLLSRHPDQILRVKGLVHTAESPKLPLVVQAVNTTLSPFEWLKEWRDKPSTFLTVIHTGNIGGSISDLFNSVLNIPTLDQPDSAAISDNPLSIPGTGNFVPTTD